ncbi:MAG: IS110 family transposase [Desulfovibrionaceae bacterium]|nr:IS110 family transposase [Desulfovibrionaceae bacterium]
MKAKQAILDGKSAEEITELVRTNLSKKVKATKQEMLEAFSGDLTEPIKRAILSVRAVRGALESEIANEKEYLINQVKELEGKNYKLIQTIPGISEWTATVVLIEIGGTANFLPAFANADRFAAWTAICPSNNQSANKKTGNKRRKGNKYLRKALCEAAHAAVRTKGTTFKSKYQGLVIRLGTKKSIVAIAHKISNMIYYVLSHQTGYVDPNINYQQKSCKKNAARWAKQLSLLDDYEVSVVNKRTGEVLA